MPEQHANLAPSASHRWFECPGSIRMEALFPKQDSSVYAEEGSVAHALAEYCLRNNADASVYVGVKASTLYKQLELDDFLIDAEMAEYVQVYLDVVREDDVKVKMNRGSNDDMILEVEKQFKVTDEVWGTNDACTYVEQGKLTIYDLKYGKGVVVEVEDNTQLMIYLLGASQEVDCWEFEIVIVQPRAPHPDGPVRRKTVTIAELQAFKKKLEDRIDATRSPDASRHAGEHCRWCAAAGACPAQKEKAMKIFGPIEVAPTPPETIGADTLGHFLQHIPEMEKWFDKLKERGKELLLAGEDVPGMKMVRSAGNRYWKDTTDVEALAEANDIEVDDIYGEPKIVSPSQFEKLLTKGGYKPKQRKEIMDGMCGKPSGQALVPMSDKREAIRNAKETFSEIELD